MIGNDNQIMVTIRCLAYNHAPYIRQCLEGFVMQKTNFRFEAIVHDDASTDGTAAIIKEYADKYTDFIKPIFETENQYSKHDGTIGRIMRENTHGKYVAICEGDDYWIDPLKLQKQVDFLEGHPDYSMSHTSIVYYLQTQHRYVKSNDIEVNSEAIKSFSPVLILLNKYRIQTVSVLYRDDDFKNSTQRTDPLLASGYFPMGDTPSWYALSLMGKIHFLPEVTCVYRKNEASVTGTRDLKKKLRFILYSSELRLYLSQRDSFSINIIDTFKKKYAMNLMAYQAIDRSFMPYFPIEIKQYVGSGYFLLFKLGLFGYYIKGKEYVKNLLRPVKYKVRNSL